MAYLDLLKIIKNVNAGGEDIHSSNTYVSVHSLEITLVNTFFFYKGNAPKIKLVISYRF